MRERQRIATYFAPLAAGEAGSFNLTDDAAVLIPPSGHQLVITTDSVIEGIHIIAGATPQQFAQKLMRRNLSDLAAMGATPWRYTLNIHTPTGLNDAWFAAFAAALGTEQNAFDMVLAGGDSTSGGEAIHVTMTCFGIIDAAPLRRSGARVGDDVYVSGSLGDAAHALQLLQHKQPVDAAFAARYFAPTPRIALGQHLRTIASACIDISDGLVADLTQLTTASNVAAVITQSAIPHHAHADVMLALTGGDDYELCFTAAPSQRETLDALETTLRVPLTRIGSIVAGNDVQVIGADGKPVVLSRAGFEHP